MELFICAFIILVILLSPFFVFTGKRLRTAFRIRRACILEGHRLIPLHLFWFLGLNNSPRADFLIRLKGGRAVYTVKLFGALHKLSNVYFIRSPKGEFSYKWKRVIPLAGAFGSGFDDNLEPVTGTVTGGINHVAESARKTRNTVDYDTPTEGESIVNIPILLCTPAPLNIREATENLVSPSLLERPPMFTKREDTRIESKVVYESNLLHGTEHVFSVPGFVKELSDLHLPKDYGVIL
ncbi:MAG: hypothetical protein IKQ92_11170 [Clostridia bacterium]|nr:hypothetical protein [Clostridia bacterium]